MIAQSVHFTFASEDADEIESALLKVRDASRKEPGVVSFEVGRSRENPGIFALWEVYRDAAALEAHTNTEHFKGLVVGKIRILAKERRAEIVELL